MHEDQTYDEILSPRGAPEEIIDALLDSAWNAVCKRGDRVEPDRLFFSHEQGAWRIMEDYGKDYGHRVDSVGGDYAFAMKLHADIPEPTVSVIQMSKEHWKLWA